MLSAQNWAIYGIPAGGAILVENIGSYVSELQLKHDAEADATRFTLPTLIASRYGSQPGSMAAKRDVCEEGTNITVDTSVDLSSFIQTIQSPSHPILVSMGILSTPHHTTQPLMHQASATLALETTHLSKDFILIISSKGNGLPTAFLEAHASIPNQSALMVDLVPKFSLPSARQEIIFAADRSGSMVNQIPTLISALKVLRKSLPVGVKFNICSFASTPSFLWSKSPIIR